MVLPIFCSLCNNICRNIFDGNSNVYKCSYCTTINKVKICNVSNTIVNSTYEKCAMHHSGSCDFSIKITTHMTTQKTINVNLKYDNTYPRILNKCPNKCKGEVIIMNDSDTIIKYIYMCTTCNTSFE
jgi:hypothetical protein